MATESARDAQLKDVAYWSGRLWDLIEHLLPEVVLALDKAGWHSEDTVKLKPELLRLISCADKAKLGGTTS